MDTIVLDIETKHLLRDIGRDPAKMPLLGVSVVGIYSYRQDIFFSFRESEFLELEKMLEQSSQVVGFNLLGFDYPVLRGHLDFDFSGVETVDIMNEISRIISRRISLNLVAQATLGEEKSADGLKAVEFYHAGKWKELEKYCLDDVRLTRDLFDYGREYHYIKIPGPFGFDQRQVPVGWVLAEESKLPPPTRSLQERLF